MATEDLHETLLSKALALPIFASDALSSVAYATEATLTVLVAASLASAGLVVPISVAIAALMAIVVISYRQTIAAYPTGGGAYVVARENLGAPAGLVAAASLLVDYVLTVAVSVVSGVLAVTSAIPALHPWRLGLSLACVGLITFANLRGVRESGRIFAAPTYLFIGSLGLTIVIGAVKLATGASLHATVPDPTATGAAATVGLVVVLRAFASGCSALTGVEAISNGVTAFKHPQARNASRTLAIMGAIAIFLFMGVSILADRVHARPSTSVSVLSEIARAVYPAGGVASVGFYVVQAATFAVLVLAANTAFQGFPRLAAIVAQDDYLPRQFENLGDRLVYSNGMLVLAGAASLLILAFDASVDRLIQLYLVGVFTAFTLSQAGMVRRWWGLRSQATPAQTARRLAANGVGAVATGLVSVVVVATKFSEGAWMVIVAIPVIVTGCIVIHRHYAWVTRRLFVERSRVRPKTGEPGPVVVAIDALDAAAADAVGYVRRVLPGGPRRAVWVGDPDEAPSQSDWRAFAGGTDLPLHVLEREASLSAAVARYARRLPRNAGQRTTVVIPELFDRRSYLSAVLRRSFALKLRLLFEQEIVVCDLPYLDGTPPLADGAGRVTALVLAADASLATLRALDYARTLHVDEVRAVSIALSSTARERVERSWRETGLRVPLTVMDAPFRDLGAPLRRAVREVTSDDDARCVVILPELVVRKRWRLLHNQRAFFVKRVLLFEPRVALTSVPQALS
jgi:amino acid transporter